MHIEAVTICVGYGDFLAETVKENQHLLDDWVIVTSPDDDETRAVCHRHSLRHVLSEDHRRGGPFNKARMVQRGFDQIGAHGWVLHLDGDIVLPRQFRSLLEMAHPDERAIYGADRCNIVGYGAWQKIKRERGSWDNHAYHSSVRFEEGATVGTRWASKFHGYVPIGFFQFFHGSAMVEGGHHVRHYPYHHGDAARTDVQFALQWDRRYRRLLPEVVVLHLESEPARLGANWCGRTTARFGPQPMKSPITVSAS